MQLDQNLEIPHFDGRMQMWEDIVWDWEKYWNKVYEGGKGTEIEKLHIFNKCLSPDLQCGMQILKRGL